MTDVADKVMKRVRARAMEGKYAFRRTALTLADGRSSSMSLARLAGSCLENQQRGWCGQIHRRTFLLSA